MSFAVWLIFGLAFTGRAGDAEFVVHSVDGVKLSGPLRKLSADWSLRLGGDKPALVAGQDLIGFQRANVKLPAYPQRNVLLFANGDRLPLDLAGPLRFRDDQLLCVPARPVRPAKGLEITVGVTDLAALWLAPPDRTDEVERFVRELIRGQRRSDVVLLRNGDRVEGSLLALDGRKGCTVKAASGKVDVALAQIAVIAFNTEFQSRRLPKKAYAHVVLADGGRLSLAGLELISGDPHFVGATLAGPALHIPLEHLVALDVRAHRAVHLSDLKPAKYEHKPFLGVSWPLSVDAAVTGGDLRLAGSTFDKGLGVHAASRVTYALGGQYQSFEALVGLDEVSGRRGRVRVEVLIDGKARELQRKGELSGPSEPLAIRLDIRESRELTLVVHTAGFGDVQANVNWVNARVIK